LLLCLNKISYRFDLQIKSKCTKLVHVPSAENRKTDFIPGSIDENLTVLRTSLPKQNLVLPSLTNLEKIQLAIPHVQLLKFKKMKTLYLWGACALLSISLFSCSADELESSEQKTEVKKEIPTEGQASEPDPGPGDEPINVPPPPKK